MVPVALILGAGANIGQALGHVFAEQGYKVALVARSIREQDSTDKQLNIKADFADPTSVVRAFDKVKTEFGIPTVVIHNAAKANFGSPRDPFSALNAEALQESLNINLVSTFVGIQQSLLAWADLPSGATSPTFIHTGNILNIKPMSFVLDLTVGKAGTAGLIQMAAETKAYTDKKYKFYFADQRNPDGSSISTGVDAYAHAKLYYELSQGTEQGLWHQTFIAGKGYHKF